MKNDYNQKKRFTIIVLSFAMMCIAGSLFWYMGTQKESQINTESSTTAMKPTSEPEKPEGTPQPSSVASEEPTSVPENTPKSSDVEPEHKSEPESTPELSTVEPEPTPGQESMSESSIAPTPTSVPENNSIVVTEGVQKKPSDGKPKTPEEAKPPVEPPNSKIDSSTSENTDKNVNKKPEQTTQDEEIRSDGSVFVPGFGWIPNEGENSTGTAPNAGTGKPVGEM